MKKDPRWIIRIVRYITSRWRFYIFLRTAEQRKIPKDIASRRHYNSSSRNSNSSWCTRTTNQKTTPMAKMAHSSCCNFWTLWGVAVLGWSWAMKKYDAEQRRVLEWKTSLLRDYFDPEKLWSIPESAVHDYSSIGAQLKDGNRNHNWNLSDEEIRHLVQLWDPLKVYIAEPRFEWEIHEFPIKYKKDGIHFSHKIVPELMRLFWGKICRYCLSHAWKDDVFALILIARRHILPVVKLV